MDDAPHPSDDQPKPTTLGDVLYARGQKPSVSEQEWVELVRSIADADQRALQVLYMQLHRLVFTLSMRITGSRETAEELTVDVFHDVWRKASTYDPSDGSVIGWVMNQARSRAIDRLRFERRKKRVNDRPDDHSAVTDPPGPQETFGGREQERILRDALQGLTQDERQAIETAFFSELTYSETAATLNQPVGTVKTRIRSGLGKLRQLLAGH